MTSLTKASIDEMKDIASRICRDYLTGTWKSITAEDIKLKRISGGLSNFLYYVSLPDICDKNSNTTTVSPDQLLKSTTKRVRKDSGTNCNEPKEVLLRIYGQTHGEHALETMLTESVVFTLLSERNLGPKLHGIFPGGRIEQYIPARALTTAELSDYKISMKIAEKMAEIHSLDIPVSKEPDWLWKSMNRWLNTIETILKDVKDDDDPKSKLLIKQIKDANFKKEVKWLKTIIDKEDYPVLFCHNDLQEGNILLKEDSLRPTNTSVDNLSVFEDIATGLNEVTVNGSAKETDISNFASSNIVRCRKRSLSFTELDSTRDSLISIGSDDCEPDLIIIDYEYCAYNYRGFDLANHFLEWTIDYTNNNFPYYHHHKSQFPNKQQRQEFIVTYLKKLNEDEPDYTPSLDEISDVEEEIQVFSLVSHLFWCLWSVVNVHQNIEFGYWDYAVCRLREYLSKKEEYTSAK